ncbi:group I intron-associated PD-(D/E)XK endonuclease [Fictibacillus sp. Mic-4]|uniref:group I intron-associated PD-(D/E)XK endonuclease n=1 Tax=Fictibacillus sp. Mic-4 TaxID=3132826 RepID=UPI003CE78500
MYDRHQFGRESEFYVAYYLTKLGFEVNFPTGNPRWDILFENKHGRYFAQIKSAKVVDGEMKVNLRGNNDRKGYTKEDVDLIIIHERESNGVYFVPIEEVDGRVSILLRTEPPKKFVSKLTRFAKDYTKFPYALNETGNRSTNANYCGNNHGKEVS